MYWDKLHRRLVSRRRLLISTGTGAVGVSAVGLVGCGGGGEEKAGTATAGAGASQPVRGGNLQTNNTLPPPHLDPVLNNSSGTEGTVGAVYSRMWKLKSGAGLDPYDGTMEPDLALSLEQPDKTTYLYKIRQGVKWHDKPPVSGRAMTVEDIIYSFRRALDEPQSAIKGEFAMVSSVRAVDANTLEVKTKEPSTPFNRKLAGNLLWITPREVVEQKGDLKEVLIGTGPFMLENYTPNTAVQYARNPTYYASGQPYVDKQTMNLLADQSAMDAAFTTGKLDVHAADDRRAFDRLKSQVQDLQSVPADVAGHGFFFRCDRPPFQDVRVRQALALTIDYQGLIQAFTGGEGKIDTIVPQAMKQWALPPSQWGDGAKYHSKPDIAEAKKLLEAAGYGNGVEYDFYYATQFAAPRQAQSEMEAIAAGSEKAGFKPRMRPEEYAVYAQRIQGKSEYSGMLHLPGVLFADPDDSIYTYLYKEGRRFATYHTDPELDALILKQRTEFNEEERKKIIYDVQKRNLIQNYYLTVVSFRTYSIWQKRLRNYSPTPLDYGRTWAANCWLQA